MSIESTTIKSLIILPFRIHQETKISESGLGEGLADALAARLFGVEGVNIRPTSSVGGQLLKETDSFKVGKSLDVDYILEGSIFPAKDRTRFTVQLLDIPRRRVEWGAQFDERETDVFLLEDKVSERIANAVLPYLELTDHQPITDAVPAQPTGEIAEEEILPPEEAPTLTMPLEKSPPWAASRSILIPLLIVAALLAGFFFVAPIGRGKAVSFER